MRSRYGLAKMLGTVVTIAGATVITLYKGTPLLTETAHAEGTTHTLEGTHTLGWAWVAGCLIMFANCICLSAWMVLQVGLLCLICPVFNLLFLLLVITIRRSRF